MTRPTAKGPEVFFLICRILVIFIACFHANKFFFPNGSSATRHLVFVGINAIAAYGLWKRPNWFLYFYSVLMLQQWYGHGGAALQAWRAQHILDWKSIAIIFVMPVILIVLIKEKKHAPERPSNS